MHIIFETGRLYLRRFTIDDAPIIQELNSDPLVLKYLNEPPVDNITIAETILSTIILPQYKKGFGRWAAHLKGDHTFIGWCGLKYRLELDEMDLGYRFKPSFWGKGFATEAASHTLKYGFEILDLPLITARAHVQNIGSIKVLERIGMQFTRKEVVDNCPVNTYTASRQNPLINN